MTAARPLLRHNGGAGLHGIGGLAQQIVDYAVPEVEVLPKAIELAAALASKADPAMHALKKGMYPRALEALSASMDVLG